MDKGIDLIIKGELTYGSKVRIDGNEDEIIITPVPVIENVIDEPLILKSASTDCNIPLSLGIAAVCIGVYHGAGSHTREEWVEKASLKKGSEIALRIATLF